MQNKLAIAKMGTEKTCPVCEEKFWGRANQLYHFACKVKLNNKTATDRRKKGQPLREKILLNDKLLKIYYRRSRRHNMNFTFDDLIKSGIAKNKYNYTVELEGGKFIFHICYKFGWALSPESDIVIILQEPLIRAKKHREDRKSST
jgi:hypothetical protein